MRRGRGGLPYLKNEKVIKLLVVGGKEVGKTSFVRRYIGKPFPETYVPTIGCDWIVVPGCYVDNQVYLHFFDVSHKELSASTSHHALLCSNVAGVFIVLDVSSRESLEAVDAWHRLLCKYLPDNVPRVLVAHKADMPKKSLVVNDRVLEDYVRDAGPCMRGWCWTVGHEGLGDYVANRGPEARSVPDAVHMMVETILKSGGERNGRVDYPLGPPPPDSGGLKRPRPTPLCAASYVASGDGTDQLKAICSHQPMQGWLSSRDLAHLIIKSQRPPPPSVAPSSGKTCKQAAGGSAGAAAADFMSRLRCEDGAMVAEDPGWRFFAGSIDREQAEKILAPKSVGHFLLRRKDERSIVLSYKTQTAIEHALLVFDGQHWSTRRQEPAQPTGQTLPHSAFTPATPKRPHATPKQQATGLQSSTPPASEKKYLTLQAILDRVSHRAKHGICFRRLPGSREYVEVKDDEVDEGRPQPSPVAPPSSEEGPRRVLSPGLSPRHQLSSFFSWNRQRSSSSTSLGALQGKQQGDQALVTQRNKALPERTMAVVVDDKMSVADSIRQLGGVYAMIVDAMALLLREEHETAGLCERDMVLVLSELAERRKMELLPEGSPTSDREAQPACAEQWAGAGESVSARLSFVERRIAEALLSPGPSAAVKEELEEWRVYIETVRVGLEAQVSTPDFESWL